MAIYTQPSIDSLTIEGLSLGGHPNVSAGSALQLRSELWVQEMWNDIQQRLNGKRLNPLMVTSYGVTTNGVSRYALPPDFIKINNITLFSSNITGTAQTVTASAITLASSDTSAENDVLGKQILITSGSYAGNCSQVSAYNTTTKVATVTPNFSDSGITGTPDYMVLQTKYPLNEFLISNKDSYVDADYRGVPNAFMVMGQYNGDVDETGEFEIHPVPDALYGVQIRYFADLNLTDLTSNVIGTLCRKWSNLIIQKVLYKVLKDDRNYAEANRQESIYHSMVSNMVSIEAYGYDMSNLTAKVVDY